jgi:hypothetical protein
MDFIEAKWRRRHSACGQRNAPLFSLITTGQSKEVHFVLRREAFHFLVSVHLASLISVKVTKSTHAPPTIAA